MTTEDFELLWLAAGDEALASRAMRDVLEEPRDLADGWLTDPMVHLVVVLAEGVPAGVAYGHTIPLPDGRIEMLLYSLDVAEPYRPRLRESPRQSVLRTHPRPRVRRVMGAHGAGQRGGECHVSLCWAAVRARRIRDVHLGRASAPVLGGPWEPDRVYRRLTRMDTRTPARRLVLPRLRPLAIVAGLLLTALTAAACDSAAAEPGGSSSASPGPLVTATGTTPIEVPPALGVTAPPSDMPLLPAPDTPVTHAPGAPVPISTTAPISSAPVAEPGRSLVLAPIEKVAVAATKSIPAQYNLIVTSGLPGGCAKFAGSTVEVKDDHVIVKV